MNTQLKKKNDDGDGFDTIGQHWSFSNSSMSIGRYVKYDIYNCFEMK